jgi:hypothetical protein
VPTRLEGFFEKRAILVRFVPMTGKDDESQ